MGGGVMFFMGLFWLALIGLILWLVIRLLPDKSGKTPPAPPQLPAPETPLDVLDMRLARGEVDLETYTAQRAALLEANGGRR